MSDAINKSEMCMILWNFYKNLGIKKIKKKFISAVLIFSHCSEYYSTQHKSPILYSNSTEIISVAPIKLMWQTIHYYRLHCLEPWFSITINLELEFWQRYVSSFSFFIVHALVNEVHPALVGANNLDVRIWFT